jgi:hypothetical protein
VDCEVCEREEACGVVAMLRSESDVCVRSFAEGVRAEGPRLVVPEFGSAKMSACGGDVDIVNVDRKEERKGERGERERGRAEKIS